MQLASGTSTVCVLDIRQGTQASQHTHLFNGQLLTILLQFHENTYVQHESQAHITLTHAGDIQILPYAEEALRQVHGCQILMNDLHASNIVIVPGSTKSRVQVFFVDFSLSQTMPSKTQCHDEFQALKALFK